MRGDSLTTPSQRRVGGILLSCLLAVAAGLGALADHPGVAYGAAPNVRYLSPSGITIDGSDADWDRTQDFLAEMFEAGKPEKRVLSLAYARYDCAAGTMVVFIETVDWLGDPAL